MSAVIEETPVAGGAPVPNMCRRDASCTEPRELSAPGGTRTSPGSGSTSPALVARKLSLRVSGARVGDVARPAASGPGAASTVVAGSRTPRSGLRVHARGTTPPPLSAMSATRTEALEGAQPAVDAKGRDAAPTPRLRDLGVSTAPSPGERLVGSTSGAARTAGAPDDAYPWEGQP
ncbi:MAG: hypothetical protein SFX73_05985 [Kofleriaceae bacterium]|nr:hypothetical protein [Kofleriaceae bacterium]